MDLILLIDCETTGTDDKAQAIEVGCILYSVTHAAPVESFASLIRAESNPAEGVNGIPEALVRCAPEPEWVWDQVSGMVAAAGALVAYNAEFDRRFVPGYLTADTPWICAMDDLQWPRASESRSLVALALAHGLGVASAHRALTDCDLLARLFTRAHEMGADLQAMLARGLRPKATYQALVSYESNALAKQAGFRWNPDRKMWARRMATEDTVGLPFKVREVDGRM